MIDGLRIFDQPPNHIRLSYQHNDAGRNPVMQVYFGERAQQEHWEDFHHLQKHIAACKCLQMFKPKNMQNNKAVNFFTSNNCQQ